MVRKWFQRSLKNQLTVFILIAVLIPVMLLGLFSYVITVQLSKDRAEVSGKGSINQLQDTIEFIVDDIENISIFLIANKDVQNYLSYEGPQYAERREISGFLTNLAFSKDYIKNIIITPINGNASIATSLLTEEIDFDEELFEQGVWWSVRELNNTVDGKQEMITLARPIRSTQNFRLLGYLTISLSQEAVSEYLRSIDKEWSGTVLLLHEGRVLAENVRGAQFELDIEALSGEVEGWKSDERFIWESDNRKSTVFTREISSLGWHLVEIIPFEEYSSQNWYVLWLTTLSLLIAIGLITGLVIFFIAKVFKPLTVLKQTIQTSTPGAQMQMEVPKEENEISELMNSYNHLNERISRLMEEVKQKEALKRQVDLQALQSQINPHFLYNTLASIHWTALRTKSGDIAKMVSHLSSFLRFSLNKGNEYSTLEQEIDHLNHYLEISKKRYPGRFDVQFHISEELKQYEVLKLIIQPLIENSIQHGFLPNGKEKGLVQVTVTEENNLLHFEVRDTGCGIEKNQLNLLRLQFLVDGKGAAVVGKNYGLRNVNLRLILHYGADSGLQIMSERQWGTVVKFSILVRKR